MRWKSDLILLFVAAIWGSGFVAQRLAASNQLSALYFNGARFLVAGVFVFLISRVGRRFLGDSAPAKVERKQIPWMMLVGTLLFGGAYLQQAGLETTSIGNTSFITGLYVVMIPLIVSILWREKVSLYAWIAVSLAAIGGLLLSLQGELRFAKGDVLVFIGAFVWAFHVIMVGRVAARGVDVLVFSVVQFITCGVLNIALALILDPQGLALVPASWQAILYSALIPIGMGFTLQIVGQRHAPAVDAAIILSMEAVFGGLFGYLFMQELMTPRQLAGCGLILAAMILAQVRPGETSRVKSADPAIAPLPEP